MRKGILITASFIFLWYNVSHSERGFFFEIEMFLYFFFLLFFLNSRHGLPFCVSALQSKASHNANIQGEVELIERCHLLLVSLNCFFFNSEAVILRQTQAFFSSPQYFIEM